MRLGLRARFALTLALAIAVVAVIAVVATAAIVNARTVGIIDRSSQTGVVSSATVVATVQANVSMIALVVAGLATVLALPLGWIIAERPSMRIERLAMAAAGISPERPGARLPVDGKRDEIDAAAIGVNRALDRLAEAQASQDRFIANASHELRTPLAAARTALEAPTEQGRVPEDLAPELGRALGAVRRAEEITAALLRLARTAAPLGELTGVDAADAVAAAAEPYREDAEREGRAIAVEAQPVTVRTDPTLFGQAIANLVDNAVRHGTGDVDVHGTAVAGGYRVTVTNAGPGYTAEEAARLVEPFHRGPHTRLAGEGSGLGLALVDTIARRLGGSLTLEPRDGGGLVAQFTTGG